VAAGGSRTFRAWLSAMPPGVHTQSGLALDAGAVDGVYRIVWSEARRYDGGDQLAGSPLPLESRVSNSFVLAAP
jgi:hypothetical protein